MNDQLNLSNADYSKKYQRRLESAFMKAYQSKLIKLSKDPEDVQFESKAKIQTTMFYANAVIGGYVISKFDSIYLYRLFGSTASGLLFRVLIGVSSTIFYLQQNYLITLKLTGLDKQATSLSKKYEFTLLQANPQLQQLKQQIDPNFKMDFQTQLPIQEQPNFQDRQSYKIEQQTENQDDPYNKEQQLDFKVQYQQSKYEDLIQSSNQI